MRPVQRQGGAGVRYRAEGGIVDPAQAIGGVEAVGAGQHIGVGGRVGADDHLGRLARGCEAWRLPARAGPVFRGVDAQPHPAHGALDLACGLLRRQSRQAFLQRQLDVHRQPIGIEAGLGGQLGARAGDQLQVDVAAKVVRLAQGLGDQVQLLLGVVGGADHAGGQEQALDIVALVEIQGEVDHLGHAEPRALDV